MANSSINTIRIQGIDGDVADVTSNRLDVNATLVAGANINIGDVEILGHATVSHFAQNVTDSAVVLTDVTCNHADIMANLSNTGIVYIGAAAVSATTGIALYPGDVYSVDVIRTAQLYCISTVSGDDINIVKFN